MNRRQFATQAVLAVPLALLCSPAQAAKGATVLVAGASGRTGRLVVNELVKRGYRVRALVRSADKARGLFDPSVEITVGDVRDIDSLRPAMRGARYVISTVGAGGGPQS
ncbi:MAG: NAD(P)H-binding protein, partial [Steroidobacteraceae bacterium]|nr:NAD(P)H-binding protein [Steroidobacteraceae bacterium]